MAPLLAAADRLAKEYERTHTRWQPPPSVAEQEALQFANAFRAILEVVRDAERHTFTDAHPHNTASRQYCHAQLTSHSHPQSNGESLYMLSTTMAQAMQTLLSGKENALSNLQKRQAEEMASAVANNVRGQETCVCVCVFTAHLSLPTHSKATRRSSYRSTSSSCRRWRAPGASRRATSPNSSARTSAPPYSPTRLRRRRATPLRCSRHRRRVQGPPLRRLPTPRCRRAPPHCFSGRRRRRRRATRPARRRSRWRSRSLCTCLGNSQCRHPAPRQRRPRTLGSTQSLAAATSVHNSRFCSTCAWSHRTFISSSSHATRTPRGLQAPRPCIATSLQLWY